MKIRIIIFLFITSLGASLALAQSNKSPASITASKMHTVKATVQDIDYDQRQITLKTESGKSRRFEVGPDVERLSEIKKGDKIRLDYMESIALSLKSPDSSLPPTGRTGELIEHGTGKCPEELPCRPWT